MTTQHQDAKPADTASGPHVGAEQAAQTFDHPPRWVYAREPRRELDFEKLDMRWLAHLGKEPTRLAALLETCRDVVDGLKRRLRPKRAQESEPTPRQAGSASTYSANDVTIACSTRLRTGGVPSKSFLAKRRD